MTKDECAFGIRHDSYRWFLDLVPRHCWCIQTTGGHRDPPLQSGYGVVWVKVCET